jgi:hypothetical protein
MTGTIPHPNDKASPPPLCQSAPVTVQRVLREWSHADDSPVDFLTLDRLAQAQHAGRR